jgi:quinol monooxygenase YgiN
LTTQEQIPARLSKFSQKGGNVIFSVIGLSPSLKNRGQLLEILRSVLDLTRPRPGCMGCWLSEEEFLNNNVLYAEQWATEEALREHIRSDLYLRLLSAIELSQRPPEVSFYYATETRGFDLVETVRQQLNQNRRTTG